MSLSVHWFRLMTCYIPKLIFQATFHVFWIKPGVCSSLKHFVYHWAHFIYLNWFYHNQDHFSLFWFCFISVKQFTYHNQFLATPWQHTLLSISADSVYRYNWILIRKPEFVRVPKVSWTRHICTIHLLNYAGYLYFLWFDVCWYYTLLHTGNG